MRRARQEEERSSELQQADTDTELDKVGEFAGSNSSPSTALPALDTRLFTSIPLFASATTRYKTPTPMREWGTQTTPRATADGLLHANSWMSSKGYVQSMHSQMNGRAEVVEAVQAAEQTAVGEAPAKARELDEEHILAAADNNQAVDEMAAMAAKDEAAAEFMAAADAGKAPAIKAFLAAAHDEDTTERDAAINEAVAMALASAWKQAQIDQQTAIQAALSGATADAMAAETARHEQVAQVQSAVNAATARASMAGPSASRWVAVARSATSEVEKTAALAAVYTCGLKEATEAQAAAVAQVEAQIRKEAAWEMKELREEAAREVEKARLEVARQARAATVAATAAKSEFLEFQEKMANELIAARAAEAAARAGEETARAAEAATLATLKAASITLEDGNPQRPHGASSATKIPQRLKKVVSDARSSWRIP